jgi:hypothetical protein
MNLITSRSKFNNSKLFFSKIELSKILDCYALGVSRGSWKDYAIFFSQQEASFFMFKHSLASPDCTLTKTKKNKKGLFVYNLKFKNNTKNIFAGIDDSIALIRRRELKII